MNQKYVEHYVDAFQRLHGPDIKDKFSEQRSAAMESFQQQGFPHLKLENWKYTDVRRLIKTPFSFSTKIDQLAVEELEQIRFAELNCHELVFINGIYQEKFSRRQDIPEQVLIKNLAQALKEDQKIIGQHLTRNQEAGPGSGFIALNTAFLQHGALIYIPANTIVEQPINLLYLSGYGDTPFVHQPRNLIILGENAQVTVIESYVGKDQSSYFTNTVSEISLGANSQLQHYKVQQESLQAFHIGNLYANQDRDSYFESHSISLGGSLARNDIFSRMQNTGAEIILNGLYIANGKQHIDNHSLVDHLVPNTHSNQTYRGVIHSHGRAVFNGKVVVHKDAQKTEAHQSNANLLLSDDAEVDTKPELEIYADDVKCSHGATVGQLDQDMLFYLQSRAIDRETAKSLLTFAFADEVISKIKLKPIRDRLERLVIGKLPDADVIKEFAHE